MKKKRKYIYLEKCLIIRILQIYIFSFYDFFSLYHFPMQNLEKMVPRISSVEIWPVISPR